MNKSRFRWLTGHQKLVQVVIRWENRVLGLLSGLVWCPITRLSGAQRLVQVLSGLGGGGFSGQVWFGLAEYHTRLESHFDYHKSFG